MFHSIHYQKERLEKLVALLADNNELLSTHPNDLNLNPIPSTWDFLSEDLVSLYISGTSESATIPEEVRNLVIAIRTLQLSRNPIPIHVPLSLLTSKGMSPKKMHEVQRMATYIKALIDVNVSSSIKEGNVRIVDVGAGQAYLTRTLAAYLPQSRILALDADEGQTAGAHKLAKGVRSHGKIDHRTTMLDAVTLLETVDEWIQNTTETGSTLVPVVFVALHACGSLTPDILRAFITASQSESTPRLWYPFAVVAVGCCYNLMYPGDFPLSRTLLAHPTTVEHPLPLSAYHLAAQIPETWLETEISLSSSVVLSIRKVVWRALLQKALPFSTPLSSEPTVVSFPSKNKSATVPARNCVKPSTNTSKSDDGTTISFCRPGARSTLPTPSEPTLLQGIGQTPTSLRLGKLPDSAYMQGWSHFVGIATKKMGVSLDGQSFPPNSNVNPNILSHDCKEADVRIREVNLERRLEILHILRCLLGPVVESAILLDRICWVKEELDIDGYNSNETKKLEIDLVNLFDQKTGSGRNVAIVLAPELPVSE